MKTQSKLHSTEKEIEKFVLIGIITQNQNEDQTLEYLKELSFLVDTAGGISIKKFIQRIDTPNPKTYVGAGKLEEIRLYIEENKIDIAVFDDELSPSQLRNIEKVLNCKILDRNNLILDIFASRARTAHAKTQVELAQYQYLLPRLTNMWTHLSKQKGGIGMKGPGETEIETDRRIIRDKISHLKEKLKVIDRQNETQRKNRDKLVRVALVGYTNVGKSTIMNMLSKSDVFAENKLFATLDTTVRKVVIENLPFLLSDTVGFIRKLPHSLIESFKSTLDEAKESDILLHVIDISHPNFEEQMEVVNATLKELDCLDKPMFLIFNKIDQYTFEYREEDDIIEKTKVNFSIEDWKNTWMNDKKGYCLFISALMKENIDEFKSNLYNEVKKIHLGRFPYDKLLY